MDLTGRFAPPDFSGSGMHDFKMESLASLSPKSPNAKENLERT
jgi:hypothetical protein